MRTRRSVQLLAALSVAVVLSSCSSVSGLAGRVIGSTANATADSAGKTAGDSMGNALGARFVGAYSPMMAQMYMGFVFSMAFGSGGYAVGTTEYRVGEYTRWSIPNKDQKVKETLLERAYLFDDKDGNGWWKVKWVLDPSKADDSTMIIEALLDKQSLHLLRMRAKMPNEKEGKEVPVTDATYYHPPQKLTKQSIEGAIVGSQSVTVPAGTFTARKCVYGDGAGGSSEWYLVEKIPGGNVKLTHQAARAQEKDEGSPSKWEMSLVAYGKGAASELGIKP